jgi:hypothetical protein
MAGYKPLGGCIAGKVAYVQRLVAIGTAYPSHLQAIPCPNSLGQQRPPEMQAATVV